MIETLSTGGLVALAVGTREPGMIVGPIAKFLGVIYNVVFNFIYGIIQSNSLGIAIILFTILVKVVLIPLMYKSQQSNYKMQRLQPEMTKIKKKYESKKDAESQQKMAMEMQKLQKDNNVNMMGGCLPMLIQLPILYALFYIFQQAYIYIDVVGANYQAIADVLVSIPVDLRLDIFTDMIVAHKATIDVASTADMMKLINMLTATEWNTVITSASDFSAQLTPLLAQKTSIETFMGISMISKVGFSFPGILIPIVAGLTTYFSSVAMTRKSTEAGGGGDPSMQMMKSMNVMMPIMMGGMCITMPGGIGIYWTISNLIQVGQTVLLNKYFRSRDAKESKEVL
ncbi:MAG: YidC/Oxa1 family membrane protein insertase [Anaerotignaceae bacterium]